jgi:hypothetical protein
MESSNVIRLLIGDNPIPPTGVSMDNKPTPNTNTGIGGFGLLIAIIIAAITISVPFLIRAKKCDTAFYMSLVPAGIQVLAILLGVLGYFALKSSKQ